MVRDRYSNMLSEFCFLLSLSSTVLTDGLLGQALLTQW